EVLLVFRSASHSIQVKSSGNAAVEVNDLRIFPMNIVRIRQIDVRVRPFGRYPLPNIACLLGYFVECRAEALMDDALLNLRPSEICRTVSGEVCEKVLNVFLDIWCEHVVLVEGVDDELDLRRALHQRPGKDPNLLCETAASKGDHSVEGA